MLGGIVRTGRAIRQRAISCTLECGRRTGNLFEPDPNSGTTSFVFLRRCILTQQRDSHQ